MLTLQGTLYSMMDTAELRRRPVAAGRRYEGWADHQHMQYPYGLGPDHAFGMSVLSNRRIGPSLNVSPSRPRGTYQPT